MTDESPDPVSAPDTKAADEPVGAASAGAAPKKPKGPSKWQQRKALARKWWAWFYARYFFADPRTLGLSRIVIGLLLCGDCLRHWSYAGLYYSNEGVLSNHFGLFKPATGFNFSLFHSFSSLNEVHVAFGLSFVCYFLFAIGYRTRLFNILALLWVTSMDHRMILVENGGYIVVNLVVFWSIFLPMGSRFSVDALRRGIGAAVSQKPTLADVAPRTRAPIAPHWSLASFLILANFGMVYFFNVVNKYGSTWRRGLTVHYVLHLDRMVTGIAVFFRELLPLPALVAVSHVVLVVEATLVMLIFWPYGRRVTRPLVMILALGLHGAFGSMFRLGPFSWFMIGWSTFVLHAVHWEIAAERMKRRISQVTLEVDQQSIAGIRWAQLLKSFDHLDRLQITAATVPGLGLAVGHPDSANRQTGKAALQTALKHLPLGRVGFWCVRVGSFGLMDLVLSWAAAQPEGFARFWGWDRPARSTRKSIAGSARLGWIKWRTRFREGTLAVFLLLAVIQLLNENKSIPRPVKPWRPQIVSMILGYPRLFQGWGMFSPNPIRIDGALVIDARTVDGRRIDPLTGKPPVLDLTKARGLGLGQIPQDYGNRIRLSRNKVFLKPLTDHLLNRHKFSGDPADELVSFDVLWLRDHCPEPGSLTATKHESICIKTWRKPGYRKGPNREPLPPPCKIGNADKVPVSRTEKKPLIDHIRFW